MLAIYYLNLSWGGYDVVILSSVLEHLMDLKGCISYCEKLLTSNGKIIVVVPDLDIFDEYEDLYQEFSTEHINYFDILSLVNFMSQGSFGLVSYEIDRIQWQGLAGNIMATFQRGSRTSIEFDTDEKAIDRYINVCAKYEETVRQKVYEYDCSQGIYIWGLGTNTAILFQRGILNDTMVKGVFDSNRNYQGKVVYSRTIQEPKSLVGLPSLPILISSRHAYQAIRTAVMEMGLTNPIMSIF